MAQQKNNSLIHQRTVPRLLGAFALLLCIAYMVVGEGCYSARIATKHVVTRDTLLTVNSWFWGAVEPQPIIGDDTYFTAMWDVEVYQSFTQRLLTIVTLGVYAPLTVHCYFAVPDQTIR